LAVGGPRRLDIFSSRSRYLYRRTAIGIHHVNMLLAVAVAGKGELRSVRRPVGRQVIGRIIGELRNLAVDARHIDLPVAVAISQKNELRAVGRPPRRFVIRGVVGYAFEIGSVGVHDENLTLAFDSPRKGDVVAVQGPHRSAIGFIVISSQVFLSGAVGVHFKHIEVAASSGDKQNLAPVRRPLRTHVILGVVNYSPDVRAIGIHHVDVEVVRVIRWARISIARERNEASVR
jgi:hypothetical protein